MNVETGQMVYEQNANKEFVPASTVKILTALMALKVLGPEFRFETGLAVAHKSHRGKLNLYLKFSGDPSLTKTDLLHLFQALQRIGFKDWYGDVIIDDTCYGDMPIYNPAMIIEDMEFCLGRPVGPIIINGNCDQMTLLFPKNFEGVLSIKSQENFYNIRSTTALRACGPDESFDKKIIGQHIIFSGCLEPNTSLKQLCIPIQDPKVWGIIVIKEIFQDLKINFHGKIKFGKMPKDAPVISHHFSDPLTLLLNPMMKNSDNLFADAIFLKIGEKINPKLQHWAKVGNLMKELIKVYYDVNLENSRIVDGSGLSRWNLLSPKQLAEVLRAAFLDLKIRDTFLSILAEPGEKGTLEYHLSNSSKIFLGKTGYMTNIRNLVGYVKKNSKPPLVFVMMGNGISGSISDYKKGEEEMIGLFF